VLGECLDRHKINCYSDWISGFLQYFTNSLFSGLFDTAVSGSGRISRVTDCCCSRGGGNISSAITDLQLLLRDCRTEP
jgi:hypothetical protein